MINIDYTAITSSNFYVTIGTGTVSRSFYDVTAYAFSYHGYGANFTVTPSVLYDNTTGVLSISASSEVSVWTTSNGPFNTTVSAESILSDVLLVISCK